MIGTLKKRMMSLLSALTVLVSVAATIQITDKSASAATKYNSAGAVKYAKEHWNDGIGACATFVSDCIAGGGGLEWSSFGSSNVKDLYYNLINGGYAKSYQLDVSGYTILQNSGKLSPGDPIIFYCSQCKTWVHTTLCTGYNDNGIPVACGHNIAQYDKIQYVNASGFPDHAGHCDKLTAYSLHMETTAESDTPPKIFAPKNQAEVETRLNAVINGEFGDGKTFPYTDSQVPASLAGEAGGTRTDGYARYVFFQLFGIPMSPGVSANQYQLTNSNGNLKTIASCGGTSTAESMKADVFKTKPGDVIQGRGNGFYQTMVVASYNENGITVLDCDNDYKCGVDLRTRDWSKFAGSFEQYTIYRSKNYPSGGNTSVAKITAPKTQAEVETRLNAVINGEFGDGKTFPYTDSQVPDSLAGEAGGTRTDGYARYVFFQLFGIPMSPGVKGNQYQLSNTNENLKMVASCSGTSSAATMKADVFKALPGDIIQGKGDGFYQTMIVVSYDENSITVLDCDNDYNCGILERTRDWSRFSGSFKQYTIYRSKNYPVKEEIDNPSTTIQGDINDDGKVDMSDVALMMAYYINNINNSTLANSKLDYNNNGRFDLSDVTALLSDYVNGRV